jgi:cytidine deaminase
MTDPTDRDFSQRWPDVERRAGTERRAERDRRAPRQEPADSNALRYNPAERRKASRRSGTDRRSEDGWDTVPLEDVQPAPVGSEEELLAAAAEARTRAHAQYSHFEVGAALETADGIAITGCNIENASYGLTLCAERVALVKALSDGHEIFTRIVILAETDKPTPPCGPCRQLLWEYCGDIDVILANSHGVTARHRLSELFPFPFDSKFL